MTALDALHLHKIDLAGRRLVVNTGGCIEESTSREIASPAQPASRPRPSIPRTRSGPVQPGRDADRTGAIATE